MEKLIIQGGTPLEGRIRVSSAKNAVLPIIAATLLASTPSTLLEIPDLEDVHTICDVIASLGVKVTKDGGVSHGNNFTSRIIKKALWKRAEYHQSLERYIFSSCQR